MSTTSWSVYKNQRQQYCTASKDDEANTREAAAAAEKLEASTNASRLAAQPELRTVVKGLL